MSSLQQPSTLSSSPSSLNLMVTSPNPSNSGRWSPLSIHGLPREPKSPAPTFRSSYVLSPMSVTSPNSNSSGVDLGSSRSHASYASYASYASSSSLQPTQPHHRFDPLSPTASAYSSPSYTSSITLQPPPAKRTRLPIIPASPHSPAEELGIVSVGNDAEQMSRGTGGFCRRVFKKLGRGRGGARNERKDRKRAMREDVVKIEAVHWTEA